MKRTWIILGIWIAAAAGIAVWFLVSMDDQAAEKTVSESAEESVVPSELSEEAEKQVSEKAENGELPPFALELLARKQFDGRDLTRGQVLENNSAYTKYFITYKSGELTISGIMLVPKGEPPAGGWPVLILNHGHIDTDIYTNGRGLKREQDYLARQGFLVIHPDYRNHAASTKTEDDPIQERLGYAEDVVNAVYAVRASDLPVNKEEIGMLGHSMGGGIAETIMVVRPDLVRAYVLYAPVSMDYRDSFERWMKEREDVTHEVSTKYGTPEKNPDFWDAIAPAKYADRIAAPVIIYHGAADQDVPLAWSQETYDLLKSQGKNIELTVFPGERHEFGPRWEDFMRGTAVFFRSHGVGSGK